MLLFLCLQELWELQWDTNLKRVALCSLCPIGIYFSWTKPPGTTTVIFMVSLMIAILFLNTNCIFTAFFLKGLIGTIMLFIDAQHSFSIDARRKKLPNKVPFWNYFLLKFQFVILYFMAGLKKTNSEWLSAYTMTNLSYHWVFSPFR